MNAWYLLYCKPKNEIRAQQNLNLQHIQTYLPMVRQKRTLRGKDVVESVPLFPNYIFARFDPAVTSVARIKSTRGVASIIDCREQMTPLCHLVFALRRQEKALGILNEDGLPLEDLAEDLEIEIPEFQPGEKVKFKDGPFAALEGVFEQKSGDKRCMVLLQVLGKLQSTKVSIEQLVRVEG
ncbi:transcription/translation regulatory transformer protein RfaH [Shewanella submarina]|uniref:Transcription/translation regulatory transformer protein RfaH n=1 Tax=Shewanella submarina TaxID=2016376 RepID=A0ABV7GKS9_9GAMM|nr:transcription/translation regulatory transformer protein RfaH [Shewanella submarina]MCL1036529.1 transcription/translation regulatory transformer protein RfaH [Shewanella submarina]